MERRPTDTNGLASRVASLETDTSSIKQSVERLVGAVESLSGRISQIQKANWPVVIGCAGVFVTIGGLLYSFHGNEIKRIEGRIAVVEKSADETSYHRGRADEARENIRSELAGHQRWIKEVSDTGLAENKATDDRLQREMRDVAKLVQIAVDALDVRLQGEITRTAMERHEQISSLKDLVNDLAGLQREASGIHADLSARVANLERTRSANDQ